MNILTQSEQKLEKIALEMAEKLSDEGIGTVESDIPLFEEPKPLSEVYGAQLEESKKGISKALEELKEAMGDSYTPDVDEEVKFMLDLISMNGVDLAAYKSQKNDLEEALKKINDVFEAISSKEEMGDAEKEEYAMDFIRARGTRDEEADYTKNKLDYFKASLDIKANALGLLAAVYRGYEKDPEKAQERVIDMIEIFTSPLKDRDDNHPDKRKYIKTIFDAFENGARVPLYVEFSKSVSKYRNGGLDLEDSIEKARVFASTVDDDIKQNRRFAMISYGEPAEIEEEDEVDEASTRVRKRLLETLRSNTFFEKFYNAYRKAAELAKDEPTDEVRDYTFQEKLKEELGLNGNSNLVEEVYKKLGFEAHRFMTLGGKPLYWKGFDGEETLTPERAYNLLEPSDVLLKSLRLI